MTSTTQPPPPPPPPPRPEEQIFRERRELWRIPPSTLVLVSVVVGGIAFDLGVRHPMGLLSLAAIGLTAAAGMYGGWIRGPLGRRLLLVAFLPASMLLLRDSPWLIPLNVAGVIGLLILAATVRPEPHAVTRALGRVLHPVSLAEPAGHSVDLIARSARAAVTGHDNLGRRLVRFARGLAIGVPVVVILATLLAASDALFRSWFASPFGLGTVFDHGALVIFGAALTTALAGHGAWADVRQIPAPRRFLGPTEASIVLAGVVATYAAFVVAQVIAITAGADYVERRTGLTYGEYARAGFFQLVAAALLTLLVLVGLRRYRQSSSPRLARRLKALELSTVALTLVVVGVAIRRLFLYEAELGLTMLRLSTIIFAGFIGFVFVVTGLSIAGRLRRGPLEVVLAGALILLMGFNIANPEQIVAERNIDRFGGTELLDVSYLVNNLGSDAVPTMLTDPAVARALCAENHDVDDRVIVFNWSRSRAADAYADTC